MNNTIKFSAKNISYESLDKQELLRLKMWVARTGENSHELKITKEVLERASKTLVGKAVVAEVKRGLLGKDFSGHTPKEIPIGVVLKEEDVFFDFDDNGVEWLCAYATIWTRYCQDASSIIERDKVKNLSMEILGDISEEDEIVSMYFLGVTLLGNFVAPSIMGAKAEIIEFSELSNKIKELYFSANQEFDYDYALMIKNDYPEIWDMGGNIVGNKAFETWSFSKNNDSITKDVSKWQADREKWRISHFNDKNLNEIISAIKWGVVVSRGENFMKQLVDKEINKKKEVGKTLEDLKKDFTEEVEIEKFEEEIKEEEKVDMSDNANVDANAQVENSVHEAEVNEEKSDDYMMRTVFSELMKAFELFEEGVSNCEEMKFEEIKTYADTMMAKYAELKENYTVYMEENEKLNQFKCNYEAQMFQAKIEDTMNQVSKFSIPKDEIEKMRDDAKNYTLENFSDWSNKVKAKALDFSSPKSNDGITKMGIETHESIKTGSIWDTI